MRTLKLSLLGMACLAAAPALSAAVVSYLSGPNFCTGGTGYVSQPYCTIPGEIPLGSFPVPAAGGTYIDPNFGGLVRLLTDATNLHPYSQPNPVSAHNRYIAIRRASGASSILDFATGQVAFASVPYGDGFVWDAFNDNIHYRIDGTRILKTTLPNTDESLLVDYAQTPQHLSYIFTGGSTDTSKDNWMAFWAENEHQVCTVDLSTARTYCADYMAPEVTSRVGWGFIDYIMVSKGVDSTNGKRYVLLMGNPALGVWSVNMATGRLDFEYRGPDNWEFGSNRDGYCDAGEVCLNAPHADVMEDFGGKQYLVTYKGIESPCSLTLATMDLSKGRSMWWPVEVGGGRTTVMKLANCGENWPDGDIGCAKNSPYCVITTYRNSSRSPADLNTPFPMEPHRDQIMVMHGNGEEIKFLATTRTITFSNDSYWSQPRSAITTDGQYVVFDSNFGVPNGERIAVVGTQAPVAAVTAGSVTPAAASGSTQTLNLAYSDTAGAADLSEAWLWIRPTASSPMSNSCVVRYDRSANRIQLADDSGATWLSTVPGTAGSLANSQCSLNGAGVTVSLNSNGMLLSVPLTMQPAYAGVKQVWLMATGGAGSSGWQQLGSWNVPAPAAVVSNVSISPAAVTAASQTLTATWSDSAGSTDIASASLWITANASGTPAGSCYVTWTRAGNTFALRDDAGAVSANAQNSQCVLDKAAARATDNGSTLTLTVPLAMKAAFGGAKGVWLSASGALSGSTLQQMGTWNVPGAALSNTSVTPNAGSGASAVFTAVWADTAGAADIASLAFSITPGGATLPNGCNITWTAAANQFKLWNDAGTAQLSGSGVLQNGQCSFDTSAARAAGSGNTVTLTLPVTFQASFGGAREIWMSAAGATGSSPSQKMGTWTVATPGVNVVSATPNSGQGSAQLFRLAFSDTAGANDLASTWFWFTGSFNGSAANTCFGYYDRGSNQIRLLSDAGNSWNLAPLGAAGTLQNSQCAIDTGSTGASASGAGLTLSLAVTFKPAFAGAKELWLYASGFTGNSEWLKMATWTVPGIPAPPVDAASVSPASGAGSAQTFRLAYTDTAGAGDITSAWFWITPNFNGSAVNTCFGYYDRSGGNFKLMSDSGNMWSAGVPGGAVAMQNSQCSFGSALSAVANGNTLTLTLPVTFGAGFAGVKEIWMFAVGTNASSDWKKLGTWTVQ